MITTIEELKEKLEKTRKDVIRIEFTEEPGEITESKIGGIPYWPNDMVYPNMLFLAQINFEEVPEHELLPKSGILQFFIANDSGYGIFSEKNGYSVIYHETVKDPVKVTPIEMIDDDPPILKPSTMTFTTDSEIIGYTNNSFPIKDIADRVYDELSNDTTGSKILGYPYFTQYGPRKIDSEYDTLLLQLDSDNKHILWGDFGVGNFFINKEKLKTKDFSDVLYNWDCY